jgi:hypothetical protein
MSRLKMAWSNHRIEHSPNLSPTFIDRATNNSNNKSQTYINSSEIYFLHTRTSRSL